MMCHSTTGCIIGASMDHPKHFAFVLMPFDPAFDDVYKLGIKGAVADFDDIHAERVDEQIYREGILERIYTQIEAADLIIADMTGQNANVFYEVGYAHARKKLCILLTSEASDIPFDLKHQRHIIYNGSIATLKRDLGKDLEWARGELDKQKASHIKVSPQKNMWGYLEKTKTSAKGELDFKVDFENTSTDKPINIQSLYLYTRKQWTIHQDGKECPSSPADSPFLGKGFDVRHFLTPPLPVLQKGAWAQLKFQFRSYFAFAHRGDKILDEYHFKGICILRIVTSDGNFDFELPMDVSFDEIPF
jgi:hypothetical protein